MPNVSWTTSNLQRTVTRPVAYRIIRDLMDITQISDKTPIMFADDNASGVSYQAGSTISESPLEGLNRWPYDERVFVEVSEQSVPEDTGTTAVYRPENPPFLSDPNLDLYAAPVYRTVKLDITFKFRSLDRNQVSRWYDGIQLRSSQLCVGGMHEAAMSFTIPDEVLMTLKEIHAMTEKKYGYGDSWNAFLTDRLYRHAGLVTNFDMSQAAWVVSILQSRLVGYFDFQPIPDKPSREGDADNWIGSFTYSLTYMKPIACMLAYPYVVHQQVIAANYRPMVSADYLQDHPVAARTASMTALKAFESNERIRFEAGSLGVSLPAFDDFYPERSNILSSTVRVLTVLVVLGDTDHRTLFNLGDLGEVQLRPEVLDLMRTKEYPYLGNNYRSIFSLNLYQGKKMMENCSLVVDEDLNVRSSTDLDPRKVYHVRLGLVTNLNFISTNGIQRIQSHVAIPLLICAMNSSMRAVKPFRPDIRATSIDDRDARSILDKTFDMNTIRGYRAFTVQDLFVRGSRQTDLRPAVKLQRN